VTELGDLVHAYGIGTLRPTTAQKKKSKSEEVQQAAKVTCFWDNVHSFMLTSMVSIASKLSVGTTHTAYTSNGDGRGS